MLGLKRGTVKLVRYHRSWEKLFVKEKDLLKNNLGKKILKIEHIGSTAIPGIVAKPVLDMVVVVPSPKVARAMEKPFATLGYTFRPRKTLPWQVLYVKGPHERRTHYAHVMSVRSKRWKDDVLFRDYLRSHTADAKRYSALKKNLASKFKNNRSFYTVGKERFIESIVKKARERA